MIPANQLRIGNTIYDRHGNVCHIHAGWFYITQDPKRLADYSPIPLTPEILEKCGFTRVNGIHNRYIKEYGAFWFELLEQGKPNIWHLQISSNGGITLSGCGIFYYVHQLQNLIFALTGEELPITL